MEVPLDVQMDAPTAVAAGLAVLVLLTQCLTCRKHRVATAQPPAHVDRLENMIQRHEAAMASMMRGHEMEVTTQLQKMTDRVEQVAAAGTTAGTASTDGNRLAVLEKSLGQTQDGVNGVVQKLKEIELLVAAKTDILSKKTDAMDKKVTDADLKKVHALLTEADKRGAFIATNVTQMEKRLTTMEGKLADLPGKVHEALATSKTVRSSMDDTQKTLSAMQAQFQLNLDRIKDVKSLMQEVRDDVRTRTDTLLAFAKDAQAILHELEPIVKASERQEGQLYELKQGHDEMRPQHAQLLCGIKDQMEATLACLHEVNQHVGELREDQRREGGAPFRRPPVRAGNVPPAMTPPATGGPGPATDPPYTLRLSDQSFRSPTYRVVPEPHPQEVLTYLHANGFRVVRD